MKHTYKTSMVCASSVSFTLDGEIVTGVSFTGGCNGNLKAISKLIDGWTVDAVLEKLEGNSCGGRPTSCADQLCKALKKAREEERA